MNIKYRPEIDGLRAIAVIPVMLFHAGFQSFSGGFVGVDVFFVISGFLIASIILRELEASTFSFAKFYARRARRILPALFLVMMCCIPLAWKWMLPPDMKDFAASVMDAALSISNILFWQESGYFDRAGEIKPLLHTWSLGVEEQFYLLFPALMVVLWQFGGRRAWPVLALGALFSLALSQYAAQHWPSFNFYWLPTRAWELLSGALCAYVVLKPALWRDNVASAAGLGAIGLAIFWFDSTTPFPSLYALLPVLGTCLVLLFARAGTRSAQLLSAPQLVFVGTISYSAYLWHQPVFAFARIRAMADLSSAFVLVLVAASFGLAYLSWRFVELPFRTRQAPLLQRPSLALLVAVVSAMLLAGFGTAGQATGGFGFRLSADAKDFLQRSEEGNPRIADCLSGPANVIVPEESCVYGNAQGVKFALLGDSHASAIAFELGKQMEGAGAGFRELTYRACPPAADYRWKTEIWTYDCGSYHTAAMEYLARHPEIETVIIFCRWPLYIELRKFEYEGGGIEGGNEIRSLIGDLANFHGDQLKARIGSLYQDTIRELLRMGKRVVLVYPQPEAGRDVPTYLAEANLLNIEVTRPLSTSQARFMQYAQAAYAQLDAVGSSDALVRVKPETVFCDGVLKGQCAAEDGKNLFFHDDNHLSRFGASMLASAIVQAMQEKGWLSVK